MTVRVRFFAGAAEAAGSDEAELTGVSTVQQAVERLRGDFGPEFSRVLAQCSLMVSGTRMDLDAQAPLDDGAVLDVLPPFAGG